MNTVTQRWRDRRDSYRPAGEVIRTAEYDVAAIPDDSTAKAFVERHHYSGSFPAARWRFGLYRQGELVGVAVFSHPASDKVLTTVFPGAATDSVELGRLVLLDEVPANAETWMLGRCFEQLRIAGLQGVVSFSDPVARTTSDGRRVFGGHVGTIYQAHNATYLGRGTRRSLRILPDGRVLSARALSKVRAGERGWRYSAQILEGYGASPCPEDGRGEWLKEWVPRLTRLLRHSGNHKYAWPLHRAARRCLPASLPFPKQTDEATA